MGSALGRIRSTATFGLAVLFLVNIFLKSQLLEEINLVILLVVTVLSLLAVEGTSRIVGYFLFVAGISLLIIYKAPLEIWISSATKNLYLVVMFTLVPLLGSPIRQGDYMEPLRGVFKRYVRSDSHFYLLLSIFSSFVALMVNIAAIPLLHQISLASEKSKKHKLLSTALSRGVACAVIWSPSAASVGLILGLTGVEWISFFPYALTVAILAGFSGWLVAKADRTITNIEESSETFEHAFESEVNGEVNSETIYWRKVLELTFFGIVLIITIVLVSMLTGINTITVVAMASFVFPVIWLVLIKKLPSFWIEFKKDYFREGLPKLKNEVVLFIGAGFLATGVTFSDLGELVPLLLNAAVGDNFIFFSIAVILITSLLSAIGIHPIVTVTVIGSTVNPETYGISATIMAVLLTTTWSMGTAMAPSAANVIAMASLINRSPLDVGPRWNWPYTATLSVVVMIFLNFII